MGMPLTQSIFLLLATWILKAFAHDSLGLGFSDPTSMAHGWLHTVHSFMPGRAWFILVLLGGTVLSSASMPALRYFHLRAAMRAWCLEGCCNLIVFIHYLL